MAQIGFGGSASGGTFAAGQVYSNGIGLPGGRQMADGNSVAMINALFAYVAGHSGSPTGSISFGSAGTGAFAAGAAGDSTGGTGWYGTGNWFVNGGSATFAWNGPSSGPVWVGHTPSDGGTVFGTFGSRAGNLGGAYQYFLPPTAPPLYSATPTSTAGSIQMNFAGPGDDGGTGITDYLLQWSTDNFASVAGSMYTGNGAQVVTGLTVGTTYYFRVAARNAVTNTWGSTSLYSGTVSALSPGVPTAPTSLTATNSTTAFDTVNLSWTTPSNTGGGITGYSIYNGGVLYGTTTGTGTTFTAHTGLADNTSYNFTVRARNAYADTNSTASVDSNTATITTNGPPTAPQSPTATASLVTAGRITVTWTAPATTGAGGITHYSLYYSDGTLINSSIASGTTTYNVDGLTPGTTYSFYVRAWNAIADSVGTPGAQSSTVTAQALGQPNAPTGLTATPSTVVANRLVLAWSESGSYTGFNIYETTTGVQVLVGSTLALAYTIDNLSTTAHTYVVRARNSVTDAAVPPSDGPASTAVTGTPGTSTTQTLPNLAVSDTSGSVYNGTYPLVSVTSTTMTYAVTSGNLPATGAAGTIVNNTNTALNGSHVITALPTTTTLTYAQVAGNVPANTAVTGGTINDDTNTLFNGVQTVTAVDGTNKKVSYALTHANITSVAATGAIANQTNAVYNGTGLIITAVTATTLSYAKTNANIAASTGSGTITDTTNRDIYNGTYPVATVPTYNTFTYIRPAGSVAGVVTNRFINPFFNGAAAPIVGQNTTVSITSAAARAVTTSTALATMLLSPVANRPTVSPGETIYATVSVTNSSGANRQFQTGINFYDSSGTIIGTTYWSTAATLTAGLSLTFTVSALAPAGAASVNVVVARLAGTGALSGDVFTADYVYVGNANVPAFAGSSTASINYTYAWTGTADASTSTRTPVNYAASTLLTPYGDSYRQTSQAILRVRYRSGWAG
jgi:hypothetical protein